MGSDPASFYRNLFLYYYESKGVNKFEKTDTRGAAHFEIIFRFIDDLIALIECGEFERSFHKVYLFELKKKKENICYLEE